MNNSSHPPTDGISSERLVSALRGVDAYPGQDHSPVVMHETHVSWVFLVGDVAYKVKKPIQTGFLDYSSLDRREHFCHEEMRLDRRYAADLYLGVVPITIEDGHVRVEGTGTPIEFAVKMWRFPNDALLRQCLEAGRMSFDEVRRLAQSVAHFHDTAERCDASSGHGSPAAIRADLTDCLTDLRASSFVDQISSSLDRLSRWASQFGDLHRAHFSRRVDEGFIRECHGDLHLDNVVHWQGRLMPFDGIEFNDEFRWIDVLSDASFLAMDFAAQRHFEFGHCFINAYLQRTGDYHSLALLRWYLTYRALVRARVAVIRAEQSTHSASDSRDECIDHVRLAESFIHPRPIQLWITHGMSGSGKTTASEDVVAQRGAICLRSDLERKRYFGLAPTQRTSGTTRAELYSDRADAETYRRLGELTDHVLQSDYSVIVDAAFLKFTQRDAFRRLALERRIPFGIIDLEADEATLRQRITSRLADNQDASDANLQVLEMQLQSQQPLTDRERAMVVEQ